MTNYELPENQYLRVLSNIINNGVWVDNPRTNSKCLTVLNQTISFDGNIFPLITTRKSYWKQAIGEMLGYIRGYRWLDEFHSLGVKTWDANCNNWNSPYKESDDDCGIIYGASAEATGNSFKSVLEGIKNNPYDRGHIWNFYNPEYFKYGCLRPCMHTHTFNVLDGVLHLTSYQRSVDCPLGLNFNLVQCWFLLNTVAHLTNLDVGTVTWYGANCHIYENQIELAKEQLSRKPFNPPVFKGIDTITEANLFYGSDIYDGFDVIDYEHHPAIKYPFTV